MKIQFLQGSKHICRQHDQQLIVYQQIAEIRLV